MELEIKGKVYSFKFGVGFLKEINSRYKEFVQVGVQLPVGFKYMVARMLDEDVEAIEDMLITANKTEKDRVPKKDLDEYLESDDTDLHELSLKIRDFLLTANVCKKSMTEILAALEKKEKDQEKEENQKEN